MGGPAELSRALGTWGAVWMGLGSILGTGVFVSLGIAADVVGSGVVLAVGLAALVATANGLSSAQLAAVHPVSGGTYAYGRRFLHPTAGFAAGWMFLVAKSASAATAALGCAGYLFHALGQPASQAGRVGLALTLLLGLTLLVARGLTRSNQANVAIVSLTLLSLGCFVGFGWTNVEASLLPERVGGEALFAAASTPAALLQATALMFVAYTGYGRIATLGEEVRAPARTIPRAIVATLLVSMVLYVSVSLTAVAVVGPTTFAEATREVAAPLEVVARTYRQPWVSGLVAIGAVTAMAGVLLNLLLGLSRVLFAMARDGELPRTFEHVHEATRSPDRAIWAVGVLIGGLVLLGDVKTTWTFSAFTVLIYYGLTNLAALRLTSAQRRFPRWISAAGLVACLGLAFFVPWRVWAVGLGVLAGGLVVRQVASPVARGR